MKIAVCLHGLSIGRNDRGQLVVYEKSIGLMKKNILNLNNVDIFIHSWNKNKEEIETTKNLYEPKDFIFEKQITFNSNIPEVVGKSSYEVDFVTKWHMTKSRWYSYMKSVELKRKYEVKNDFKYDFVFVTRFDNCFFTPFIFDEYDNNYFYASDDFPYNDGFNDTFFFTNSELMDDYSKLYNYIEKYIEVGNPLSSHTLSRYHITQMGMKSKIRFTKKIGIDYQLERRVS